MSQIRSVALLIVAVLALETSAQDMSFHGLRATRPEFNSEIAIYLDPNAGEIEMYPQEISLVFISLCNNGFYAVNIRAGRHCDKGSRR